MKTVCSDSVVFKTAMNHVCHDVSMLSSSEKSVFLCRSLDETIALSKVFRALSFIQFPVGTNERLIRGILLQSAYEAEVKSAMSGEIFLRLIDSFIRDKGLSKLDTINTVKNTRYVSKENVWTILSQISSNTFEIEMLQTAFNLIGLEGKVSIEETELDVPSIEVFDGYRFMTITIESARRINAVLQIKTPRCLVIDGLIESLGEIASLLDSANQTNEPLVIFARGFDKEVVNTVAFNNSRETLNVTLIRVPYDVESVNVLNDIAVVCQTDVISSLKGELISSIKFDDLRFVDEILLTSHMMTIVNPLANHSVNNHVLELSRKRNEINDLALRSIYDNRLRSLTSRAVKITVPKRLKKSLLIENLDNNLRILKDLLSRGYYDCSEFETLQLQHLFKGKQFMTVSAFETSFEFLNKISSLLSTVETSVLIDRR